MPARTLFVGLDAADPRLLLRWSAEGGLPRFASLSRDAATYRLTNPIGTIGGGVWQELNSGRSCGRSGVFFPARQLHTGETAPRAIERHEVDPRGFWTVASEAGKRVAAVDLPQAVVPDDFNGAFLSEWGTHDRLWGQGSVPAELLDELRERHGDYAVWSRPRPQSTTAACDGHDGSPEAYEHLLDDLLAGIDQKEGLLLDVLGREEWDLFACAFGEGQCSGHQFWHFLDDGGPPETNARMPSAIREVYDRLDRALGAVVDAAGSGVTVFAVASHSFVGRRGGKQLIPEVLVRLGYGSGGGTSARARSTVPPSVRRLVRAVLPRGATQTLQARAGSLPNPLDSPQTRAAALDGDRCSWIRLNLKGREPYGSVEPGAEAAEILADIRAELRLLEHEATGERIVDHVLSAEEAFGADHHPDVPDLIVHFREDLGAIDACRSSRVGVVNMPFEFVVHRSSGHPALPSYLWVAGPDGALATSGDGDAVDLAPTILAHLGVARPDWMDGSPLAV